MANSRAADNPEQAMNQVLQAEREAQAAIARCQQEATHTVEQARQQARRIAERTDARLSHLHTHCALTLARQTEQLQQRGEAETEAVTPLQEDAVLAAAVARLAEALTSAGNGGADET